MRYLYKADDKAHDEGNDREPFAYAPGRRDFFRTGDDRLFAHESHGWLVAAESGETLAHLTGDIYYAAADGARLYRVSPDGAVDRENAEADSDTSPRRRATSKAARPRH